MVRRNADVRSAESRRCTMTENGAKLQAHLRGLGTMLERAMPASPS